LAEARFGGIIPLSRPNNLEVPNEPIRCRKVWTAGAGR
jgi:hypothetical protein